MGSVAGIVGAGGNAGVVAFGFLFRIESLATERALMLVGIAVIAVAALEIWPKSGSEGLYLQLSVIAEDGNTGKAVRPERALGSRQSVHRSRGT